MLPWNPKHETLNWFDSKLGIGWDMRPRNQPSPKPSLHCRLMVYESAYNEIALTNWVHLVQMDQNLKHQEKV